MDSIQNLFEINDGVCLTIIVLLISKAAAYLSLVHVFIENRADKYIFLADY